MLEKETGYVATDGEGKVLSVSFGEKNVECLKGVGSTYVATRQALITGSRIKVLNNLIENHFKLHPDMRVYYACVWGDLEQDGDIIYGRNVKLLDEIPQREIFEAAMHLDPRLIGYIPRKQDKELASMAIHSAGEHVRLLGLINPALRDAEVCLACVSRCGRDLEEVPPTVMTREMCVNAVINDGLALEYVPKQFRDPGICVIALSGNGEALEFIPEEEQTKQYVRIALVNKGAAYYFARKDLLTMEVLMEYVRIDGNRLNYIPYDERTVALCNMAVLSSPNALFYVPEHIKTQKMCDDVTDKDPRAIRFVPEKFRTKELKLKVLKKDGYMIDVICDPSDEEIGVALENDPWALTGLEDVYKTYNRSFRCVSKDGRILEYVPWEIQDEAMVMAAVQSDPEAVYYAPPRYLTDDIKKLAVGRSGDLNFIDSDERDYDICLLAVEHCPAVDIVTVVEADVPEDLLDERLYAAAVRRGYPLENVPQEFIDEVLGLI